MGAEKEEGRLKEDSLSDTLRVLEAGAGLGGAKHVMPTNEKQELNKRDKGGVSDESTGKTNKNRGMKQRQET